MQYIIRLMEDQEKAEVAKLGRMSFFGFESLIVPTPKTALVAVFENEIVGAVLFKTFVSGNKKIGYIDFAFVSPKMHGLGIGSQLYKHTMEQLWTEGCDYLSAVVKDDNVDSWKLLLNNDFVRVGLYQMVKELGFVNAIKHSIKTTFFVAIGMEYYLAKRDTKIEIPLPKTALNVLGYLMVNIMLFLIMMSRQTDVNLLTALPSMLILLVGLVVSGFIGTRFSKETWRYRVTNGGFLIHGLPVLFGGVFPLVGNWYPETYRKTPDFKKALGLTAMCQWGFIIILVALSIFQQHLTPTFSTLQSMGKYLIFIFAIPLYPVESFAAGRVFKWNKIVYMVFAGLSLGVLII